MIPRIFSEPVTIRDAAGSTLMVIPEWICYLCYAFFLILIVYMITSLGKMLMKNICSKRRKVWAVLELKMQEHPIPAAIHTVDENINRDGQIPSDLYRRFVYHLYFRIEDTNKQVILQTDQDTYMHLKEGQRGVLDYKGSMFYGFDTSKQAQELYDRQMSEADKSVWQKNAW